MNIFEKIISAVLPSVALRRAQERWQIDQIKSLTREYDAGKRGRRTDGWHTKSSSPKTALGSSIALLRDRSRDMIRNNPYASRAKDVFVSNVVGAGIISRAEDETMDLFKRWSDVCDADARCDFYGLQKLVCGAEYESGEVLVYFRHRRPTDGLPVPLQIQILEADHIDTSKNEQLRNGNTIIHGIEFNRLGQRAAYWLFPTHPGDGLNLTSRGHKSHRVNADQILHIFEVKRPGQVRGVPALASVLLRLRDLDEYEDAELLRKKIEACFAAFVSQPEGPDISPLVTTAKDKNGLLVENLEPGIIKYLAPGQQVTFGAPQSSGGYGEFHQIKAHEIASGARVTYQQMTGDMSRANYSSMRGGRLEFQAVLDRYQRDVMIHQFCRPVWSKFCLMGIASGVLKKEIYPGWTTPKPKPVDPLKDALADLTRVRSGTASLFDVAAENGRDPKSLLEDIAAVAKKIDSLGLVLDSDPRKVAKSGAIHSENLINEV